MLFGLYVVLRVLIVCCWCLMPFGVIVFDVARLGGCCVSRVVVMCCCVLCRCRVVMFRYSLFVVVWCVWVLR